MMTASETMDAYPHVVAMLDAKTRVVEGSCGLQWIIQQRCNNGRWPWKGVGFYRSKAGLLTSIKSPPPELLALPDWFPEARPEKDEPTQPTPRRGEKTSHPTRQQAADSMNTSLPAPPAPAGLTQGSSAMV